MENTANTQAICQTDDGATTTSSNNVKTTYDNTYDHENMNEIFNKQEQFHGIMKKYWNQRHDLCGRYDEGVLFTKELWFSVTPEVISKFTAKLIQHVLRDKVLKKEPIFVMDSFAGGGGNVNLFLEYFDAVFAVDINHIHLYCTKNNAQVYFSEDEVNSKLKLLPLNWVYADTDLDPAFVDNQFEEDKYSEKSELVERVYANKEESLESLEILKDMKLDCIFGSPPWGGPEYIKERFYDLNNIIPYPLEKLLKILLQYTDNVCLFLPKNSNLIQVQRITEAIFHDEKYVRVLRMSLHGRPKGLLVCWGPAFVSLDIEEVQL